MNLTSKLNMLEKNMLEHSQQVLVHISKLANYA